MVSLPVLCCRLPLLLPLVAVLMQVLLSCSPRSCVRCERAYLCSVVECCPRCDVLAVMPLLGCRCCPVAAPALLGIRCLELTCVSLPLSPRLLCRSYLASTHLRLAVLLCSLLWCCRCCPVQLPVHAHVLYSPAFAELLMPSSLAAGAVLLWV